MPITLRGTEGITMPGVDSDSMPNSGGDPVVESGSNSDGSWTRWADETQIAALTAVELITETALSDFYRVGGIKETFPSSFIEVSSAAYSIKERDSVVFWGGVRGFTDTSVSFNLISDSNNSSGSIVITLFGRWK